jgi:hypothetical protein
MLRLGVHHGINGGQGDHALLRREGPGSLVMTFIGYCTYKCNLAVIMCLRMNRGKFQYLDGHISLTIIRGTKCWLGEFPLSCESSCVATDD